jgi:hypothetical protein
MFAAILDQVVTFVSPDKAGGGTNRFEIGQ